MNISSFHLGQKIVIEMMEENDSVLRNKRIYELFSRPDFSSKRFIDWAIQHEIGAVVDLYIKDLDEKIVPSLLKKSFSAFYKINRERAFTMWEEMLMVLEHLNRENISSIVLKGLPLSFILWGRIDRRVIQDIDLLIKPVDLLKSIKLLNEIGYCAEELSPTWFQNRFLIPYKQDIPLFKDNILVELKPSIDLRGFGFKEKIEILWGKRKKMVIEDKEIFVLDPVYHFLLILLHALKHDFSIFKWVVDIKRFSHVYPDIFKQAEELSKDLKIIKAFIAARNSYYKLIYQGRDSSPIYYSFSEKVRYYKERLLIRGGFYNGFRFVLRKVFIPTIDDYWNFKLPFFLYFLYYIIRPFRWINHLVRSKGKKVL